MEKGPVIIENLEKRLTDLEAKVTRLEGMKDVIREMLDPQEVDPMRLLEIKALAQEIHNGNKQALKDWNKREERRQRLRQRLKAEGKKPSA